MIKLLLFLLEVMSLCHCLSLKRHIHSLGIQKEQNLAKYNGRIVGGRTVDIFMHPYQISLRIKGQTNISDFYCSGSIISPTLIVTAAHCVRKVLPTRLHVVAGSNQRTSSDGVIAPVLKIIKHERFSRFTWKNDIALVKLAAPLPLNNFTIRAIELADEEAKEGQIATVSGWGDPFIHADSLQEVEVSIISNELCNKEYNPTNFVYDDMMCAGLHGVGGKDACYGDSGGPLVIKGKLVGVVSWGNSCGSPKYMGVYARISYHRLWLLENIALHQ